MRDSAICKATDHLFLPVLEVHDALLRCVHCDVFAYQETVKERAKRRAYRIEDARDLQAATVSVSSRVARWLERALHSIRT